MSSVPEYEHMQNPRILPSRRHFFCHGCCQPCGVYCGTCLETLARTVMQLYGRATNDDEEITKALLPTDRHPADDLSILSAMCLLKLSFVDEGKGSKTLNRVSNVLQAALLLEYAWSSSKSNFQISLLLVRLYVHLGCGSLAMRAFQRLGVKQIQLDTLSYTFFDRISSFHPHPFGASLHDFSQFLSPVEHFRIQQKLYRTSSKLIRKNCWLSFENGNYNSVLELEEFEKNLSQSLSAAMSVVESKKISRLMKVHAPSDEFSYAYDILRG
jgi:N-terminal acetyltransferase B complex non-catalytic subunit